MGIIFPFRIIAIIFFSLILLYTIYLIRLGKLTARLTVSWIMTEILLIIVIAIKPIGDYIKSVIGEQNLIVLISFIVVGWIILLMLNILTRVADLTEKNRIVIQDNAILREKIESLERLGKLTS